MEKGWQKQRRIFRASLALLDEATVSAFLKEVKKTGHVSLERRHDALAQIFRNLRAQNLDQATMGYIRYRIDSWTDMWLWGFQGLPQYSGKFVHYTDETKMELWANYLLYCVQNRSNINEDLICDCGLSNCPHWGDYVMRRQEGLGRSDLINGLGWAIFIFLILSPLIFFH